MRRIIPFLFLLLIPVSVFGTVVDYIIETVNGVPILYSDVRKYQSENKVDKETALKDLTEKSILLSEAKRIGITVPESAIETALITLAKANGFKNMEEFRKAIEKSNLPFSELKKKLKEQLLIQRLLDIKVKSKLTVSPVEIENTCRTQSQTTRKVYYVQIPNKNFLNKIETALENGSSFKNATEVCQTEKNCQKGFLGNVEKGTLLKEIDKAVWNAKIKVPVTLYLNNSYYLLYVTKEEKNNCNKKKIREKIMKEKYQEELKKYISSLKNKAIIKTFTP